MHMSHELFRYQIDQSGPSLSREVYFDSPKVNQFLFKFPDDKFIRFTAVTLKTSEIANGVALSEKLDGVTFTLFYLI